MLMFPQYQQMAFPESKSSGSLQLHSKIYVLVSVVDPPSASQDLRLQAAETQISWEPQVMGTFAHGILPPSPHPTAWDDAWALHNIKGLGSSAHPGSSLGQPSITNTERLPACWNWCNSGLRFSRNVSLLPLLVNLTSTSLTSPLRSCADIH